MNGWKRALRALFSFRHRPEIQITISDDDIYVMRVEWRGRNRRILYPLKAIHSPVKLPRGAIDVVDTREFFH